MNSLIIQTGINTARVIPVEEGISIDLFVKLYRFVFDIVLFYLTWIWFRYERFSDLPAYGFRYNYFVTIGYAVILYWFKSTYDCNGCCICFAPETFDMGSMTQKENQDDSSVRSEDDYDLYNVAYIKDDELYVDKDRDKELENTYEELQNDLKNLKYEIENSDFSDEDKKSIYKCLVRLLEKPMFLFKLFPYHMEEEKRIILSRDLDDRSQVCKTPATDSNPPKLFINPPFQVFPEKIILGPKVKNVDDWIPHLQYELARIKDKWCFYDQRSYNPIVRPSEINIR